MVLFIHAQFYSLFRLTGARLNGGRLLYIYSWIISDMNRLQNLSQQMEYLADSCVKIVQGQQDELRGIRCEIKRGNGLSCSLLLCCPHKQMSVKAVSLPVPPPPLLLASSSSSLFSLRPL